MLLRTRITLIVALSLLLIVLGLGSAGLLREQLLQQRLATTALAGQASLWGEMLAAEDRLLDQGLDRLLADNDFLRAAQQRDRAALERSLRSADLLPGGDQPLAVVALLDSLQEYVLIDPDTAQVDVFRRNAANRWELYPSIGPDATVELASVGWQGLVGDLLT